MISMQVDMSMFKSSIANIASHFGKDIRTAVGRGMRSGGKELLGRVRSAYAQSIRIRRKSFPKAISTKVYDRKKDQMPDLLIGSKVPAVRAHVFGAQVTGPVLIPLLDNGERIGRKKFGLLVRDLVRSGNAEFRRVHGRTILFAEASAASASGINISAFKRNERARRGGKFRKKKGRSLEVPIAVLVRNVKSSPRFAFFAAVRTNLPVVNGAIQSQLNQI